MTVEEEIAQDRITQIGTVQDIISQEKIAEGATALTVTGRPYSHAAKELETMTARRALVIKEYEEKVKATHAALQELSKLHTRIDQIVNELSRS